MAIQAAVPSPTPGMAAPLRGLPLGLAHDIRVLRPVKKGQSLCWDDVAVDTTTEAYRLRREMENLFTARQR